MLSRRAGRTDGRTPAAQASPVRIDDASRRTITQAWEEKWRKLFDPPISKSRHSSLTAGDAMARRRRRAFGGSPELRLAYGSGTRRLGDAILSLLPPAAPPTPGAPCPACRGAAAGCLACRRWAHLLRAGDPVAYRRLVTRAVCAVQQTPAPPPPPRYTPGNAGHSQAQVFFPQIGRASCRERV